MRWAVYVNELGSETVCSFTSSLGQHLTPDSSDSEDCLSIDGDPAYGCHLNDYYLSYILECECLESWFAASPGDTLQPPGAPRAES